MDTIPIVTDVNAVEPYILDVTFSDGTCRRVDIEPLLVGEMFQPLRDPEMFRKASVDMELGTVVWPNGADLSPEFLYEGDPKAIATAGRD